MLQRQPLEDTVGRSVSCEVVVLGAGRTFTVIKLDRKEMSQRGRGATGGEREEKGRERERRERWKTGPWAVALTWDQEKHQTGSAWTWKWSVQ